MKILTAAEMSEADRRTAAEFGVPLEQMMEHAGAAVAKFVLLRYPKAKHIVVLCGKGNNGGDGFVASRHLWTAGRQVTVLLLAHAEDLQGEAHAAYQRMTSEANGIALRTIASESEAAEYTGAIDHAQLILDAIVGTGFHPPLRGVAAALREQIAKSRATVVAIDLPSGWDADSTAPHAEGAFRADAVVTFTAPKRAHIFGQLTGGPIVVADIGSPAEAVRSEDALTWTGTSKALAERPRDPNSNKGSFGHVLVVGGSRGKAGAAAMASLAALRTGAGLVTAAVPSSILNTVARITPELMTASLDEDEGGVIVMENLRASEFEALVKRATVVAVGPGLGSSSGVAHFAREFVTSSHSAMVIDADALNAFEGRTHLLKGERRTLVLTPHPGEMARLVGKTVKEVEADRTSIARKFAVDHKLTLVLKGWRTLVAHPDGRIAVNTSGNPAMSKGGSGDILTGILAAMLAQFPGNAAEAVEAAVFLHGLAADFAVRAMDEHTVLATDTLAHLSDAFRYRLRDEDGLTWLTGLHR